MIISDFLGKPGKYRLGKTPGADPFSASKKEVARPRKVSEMFSRGWS
jgi:hypothetical protein